jgi:hypothetical protein
MSELDASHNKLVKRVIGLRPTEGETQEEFCRRRNRVIAKEIGDAKAVLSVQWSFKVISWLEHLARHPDCPAARLLSEQTPLWVEACRVLSGVSNTRTMTRAGPGRPLRFLGPWWNDLALENPGKSKALTKQRAETLYRKL